MTVNEMITRCQYLTHQSTSAKVVDALNAAQSLVFNRLRNSEAAGDFFMTIDGEYTLLAAVRLLDLPTALNVTTMQAIKQMWLKLSGDSGFTRMQPTDLTDPVFNWQDNLDATNATPKHPVKYFVYNNLFVRFNALLPIGAVVRVDYFKAPTTLAASGSCDLPVSVHGALCDFAISELWHALNDTRWSEAFKRAEFKLQDAVFEISRRSQFPTRTKPYRRG